MKRIGFLLSMLLLPCTAFADVVNSTRFITVSPTVTATAYSSGQALGGKLTFTNALLPRQGSGMVVSVAVADKAGQTVDLDLVLFRQDPTSAGGGSTTITDTAALTIADADLTKVMAVINLGSASRFAYADNSTHYIGSLAIPVQGLTASNLSVGANAPSGTIYGVLVARGAHTAASTSDISVTLGIAQD